MCLPKDYIRIVVELFSACKPANAHASEVGDQRRIVPHYDDNGTGRIAFTIASWISSYIFRGQHYIWLPQKFQLKRICTRCKSIFWLRPCCHSFATFLNAFHVSVRVTLFLCLRHFLLTELNLDLPSRSITDQLMSNIMMRNPKCTSKVNGASQLSNACIMQ